MKVITGTAKGRVLVAPAGKAVRPTAALVKEAVFSAAQFEVEGARVLDLFAGSGQMGVEALSRGARSCVLIDSARESLEAIRKNLDTTGPWPNARVMPGDALAFLRGYHGEPFDIAFLDPPYADGLIGDCLAALAPHMSGIGVAFCETARDTAPPERTGSLSLQRSYRYGKTMIYKYVTDNANQA